MKVISPKNAARAQRRRQEERVRHHPAVGAHAHGAGRGGGEKRGRQVLKILCKLLNF